MTETPRIPGSDDATPPAGFQNPLFVQQQWPTPQPPVPPSTRKPRKGAVVLVAAAVAAALVGGTSGAVLTTSLASPSSVVNSVSSTATGSTVSNQTAGSISAVAASGLPSVVQIRTQSGLGSGLIISSDGQILTNNHVIDGATSLKVVFNDGSTANATVVGTDPTTDLAVIKAQGKTGLKAATLGDSSTVKVGDQVVAIGSPEGLQGTVTSGIVSALNRKVTASDNQGGGSPYGAGGGSSTTYNGAIQTDAPINPGNSGGPLFNLQGQVIGINSSIYSTTNGSIGLGFAIPINQAKTVAQKLIAGSN